MEYDEFSKKWWKNVMGALNDALLDTKEFEKDFFALLNTERKIGFREGVDENGNLFSH